MIGLIDVDSKINNHALMKLSTFYKNAGEQVNLISLPTCIRKKANIEQIKVTAEQINKDYEKVFASVIFTRSKPIIDALKEILGDKLECGGTGSHEPTKKLLDGVEKCKLDYDLYTPQEIAKRMTGIGTAEQKLRKATEIVNAGHGFSSRGCIRNCPFCMVPKCEGKFRQAEEIGNMINPKSNVLVLHDNNLTADPNCIDKLHEIRERGLVVDINQGCDVRLMNDDIAKALSEVKHLRSLHYAWDLMGYEEQVLKGISTLSKYIKPYRHMCFMLVGFNTEFEQDIYRFRKLTELNVDPYVMVFNENEKGDIRLKHFARWVNSRIYKKCSFEEYGPWIRDRNIQISLF